MEKINWEQRRWDLTCHVATGLYAGQHSWSPDTAVRSADEIIRAYYKN